MAGVRAQETITVKRSGNELWSGKRCFTFGSSRLSPITSRRKAIPLRVKAHFVVDTRRKSRLLMSLRATINYAPFCNFSSWDIASPERISTKYSLKQLRWSINIAQHVINGKKHIFACKIVYIITILVFVLLRDLKFPWDHVKNTNRPFTIVWLKSSTCCYVYEPQYVQPHYSTFNFLPCFSFTCKFHLVGFLDWVKLIERVTW